MATKNSKGPQPTRKRRSPQVVVADLEEKLALAKERMENSEHFGHPAVKKLLAARSSIRRFVVQLEEDAGPLGDEDLDVATKMLNTLDELAPKYGGRRKREEAA